MDDILIFSFLSIFIRITHLIPLKCSIPVDFEFTLSYIQLHSAFTVEPMSGTFVHEAFFFSVEVNLTVYDTRPLNFKTQSGAKFFTSVDHHSERLDKQDIFGVGN